MKSKLLSLFLSAFVVIGTMFFLTKPASAVTAEDIYYKNAFDVTANVVGYNLKEQWQLSELQQMISDARIKIKKLNPKSDAIPVFSQLLDERQQEVFVLLKKRVDNLSMVNEPYICYYQYELDEIRTIMNEIIKICDKYPTDILEKVEQYQEEKIQKALEVFNLCKANPTEDNINYASCAIYDLSNINENHPKKAFVDNLLVEFQKIQEEFYSNTNNNIKEILKGVLDNPILREEFGKYFDKDTMGKLAGSLEEIKKFIDDHDVEYIMDLIEKIEMNHFIMK
ncbi:hypothetical protein SAMN02745248_01281 [Hathewaya proteolytica DSM 3090]|uniref:Uncharacterized protein n=1 Tax=Hathewaya proteolytica DSM 3090 TaxID=1121331 RepID=A0A1M6N5S8_9CLOT|nr:hypothetical protein [Hathewaya proteolytica]SHJ91058.1 hypothetical protein SAMN02745248_01281 [Hathewaya proteolytica DSM 3090]